MSKEYSNYRIEVHNKKAGLHYTFNMNTVTSQRALRHYAGLKSVFKLGDGWTVDLWEELGQRGSHCIQLEGGRVT